MKFGNFFTKYRRNVLLLAVAFVAGCILLTIFVFGYQSLAGSLLINLAATAIFTGFTITYIDYMFRRETQEDLKESHAIAEDAIERLLNSCDYAMAQLFGFDMRAFITQNGGKVTIDKLQVLDKASRDYLEELYKDIKSIDTKHLEGVKKLIASSLEDIVSLLQLIGYALNNKERAGLLQARNNLQNLASYLDITTGLEMDAESSQAARHLVMMVHKTNKRYFPKHYR